MLYLKFILAIILSFIPFLIGYYLKKKPRSMPDLVEKDSKKIFCKILRFIRWMNKGMSRSHSFRKFFTMLFIIMTTAVEFADLNASQAATTTVLNDVLKCVEKDDAIIAESHACWPLVSYPIAVFTAFAISLSFFRYKFANYLLTKLHQSSKFFLLAGVICMILSLLSFRLIILAEVLYLMLVAAYLYPNLQIEAEPKGRKPIPKTVLREAA